MLNVKKLVKHTSRKNKVLRDRSLIAVTGWGHIIVGGTSEALPFKKGVHKKF